MDITVRSQDANRQTNNIISMKSAKKRSSLLHAHRDNDLKHMLAYYNDKSKVLQDPLPFEPIYEYHELPAEEVMLPKSVFDNFLLPFPKTRSQSHSKVGSNQGLGEDGTSQRRKVPFSREHVEEINRKLRNIRTSNYRRQRNQDQPNEDDLENKDKDIAIARNSLLSGSSALLSRKAMVSSHESRSARPTQAVLPQNANSGDSNLLGREGSGSSWSRSEQLRRNPHVIYQFESHLKAKRVDDNPRVLGNIIRKKFKDTEREDLFIFINGLIRRREK